VIAFPNPWRAWRPWREPISGRESTRAKGAKIKGMTKIKGPVLDRPYELHELVKVNDPRITFAGSTADQKLSPPAPPP